MYGSTFGREAFLMSGFKCPENMEYPPSGRVLHISKITEDIAKSLIMTAHNMSCLINTLGKEQTEEVEGLFNSEIILGSSLEISQLNETDIVMVRSQTNKSRWWLIGYVPDKL